MSRIPNTGTPRRFRLEPDRLEGRVGSGTGLAHSGSRHSLSSKAATQQLRRKEARRQRSAQLPATGEVLCLGVLWYLPTSVVDPDPSDPYYVFGPPGSGSGFFYHQAKIVRKTLIPTIL
jgi:hypothetical protein